MLLVFFHCSPSHVQCYHSKSILAGLKKAIPQETAPAWMHKYIFPAHRLLISAAKHVIESKKRLVIVQARVEAWHARLSRPY